MKYESIRGTSRQDAETAFRQRNAEEIEKALLSVALHDEDLEWVQANCLKFLEYPDKGVQATAITCLGHLARIHRTIDTATVLPALQAKLQDPDLAGRASDALDDIEMFTRDTASLPPDQQEDS